MLFLFYSEISSSPLLSDQSHNFMLELWKWDSHSIILLKFFPEACGFVCVVHACVFVHVYICYMCMVVHIKARDWYWVFALCLYNLSLCCIIWDRISHWTGFHQILVIIWSMSPTSLSWQPCLNMLGFLYGYWGMKPRSICFNIKYCYPWSHLSSPA